MGFLKLLKNNFKEFAVEMSNSNIFMQFGTIKIGQIVKLFANGIGLDALLESVSDKEKPSVKKMIQRLEKEDEIRIDSLRQFENLLNNFCKWAMDNNFMNQTHNYIVPTLYHDILALITNTNPYNNPTKNEIELQIMYCLALTFREIYDHLEKKEGKEWGYTLQMTLMISDFWKQTNYNENVKLIPSCFDFLFSDIENPKSDLFKYWENLKDSQESSKKKTNYAKSITDWIEKGVSPSWKIIKTILSSPTPENIKFKESKSNYFIFKTHLFLAYFFSNFFKCLEEQNLVSQNFKETVQSGLRFFYRYVFIVKDFRQYQLFEVQNPMFSLMRFLVLPTNRSKNLISEYIYEAFDKECGVQDVSISCSSLYYIPPDIIHFPVCDKFELARSLQIFERIYRIDEELSTCKKFLNKTISESDLEILSPKEIRVCGNFFYNWFKGKYHVLCREFETALEFYRKAFEYRYFGGKYLTQYLSEFVVLMQKCKVGKTEFNHIHEWANAVRLYIAKIDEVEERKISIKNSFDEVFPAESFIKKDKEI